MSWKIEEVPLSSVPDYERHTLERKVRDAYSRLLRGKQHAIVISKFDDMTIEEAESELSRYLPYINTDTKDHMVMVSSHENKIYLWLKDKLK